MTKEIIGEILSTEEKLAELTANLHDGISHQLLGMLWKIEEIKNLPTLDKVKNGIDQLGDDLRKTINELQRMIYGARPVLLDELGFLTGIKTWMTQKLGNHGIRLECTVSGDFLSLDRFTEGQLFRILQEGTNNIIAHSGAKKVYLHLEEKGEILTILLADEGRGYALETVANGLGIQLIKKRTALIGGQIQIKSELGRGTTLQITLPIKGG